MSTLRSNPMPLNRLGRYGTFGVRRADRAGMGRLGRVGSWFPFPVGEGEGGGSGEASGEGIITGAPPVAASALPTDAELRRVIQDWPKQRAQQRQLEYIKTLADAQLRTARAQVQARIDSGQTGIIERATLVNALDRLDAATSEFGGIVIASGRELNYLETQLRMILVDEIHAGRLRRDDLAPYGLAGFIPAVQAAAWASTAIAAAIVAAIVGAGVLTVQTIVNGLTSNTTTQSMAVQITPTILRELSALKAAGINVTPETIDAAIRGPVLPPTPGEQGAAVLSAGTWLVLALGAVFIVPKLIGEGRG